ncbi:hypothetical protein GE09DRAFT_1269282 [Coniochaeta sp. 2T2.1]|nr:hypothetical protein GE09DRAFT_1269282 [Coniochaeta sp. 2T2.1]
MYSYSYDAAFLNRLYQYNPIMSPPKPQRHLAADRPPSSACHNPPPGLLNLRRRWDPPKELSESDAKEIIQELESRNGTQLDEHVVPLCLLAFLQKNPQLLELSALSVDQAVKEEEFIDETLNPLETRGMIDLFEEDRGSGDEGHKKHYIAMPDEELKKQLISWTFNCDKRLTGTALGSDVFHRAVNFLHDSATSGIAYPSSAYYSLLGMITVTTTALEMMRQCFLKGRRYHRIVEPRDIVILGEIALRTAV